MGLANPVIMGWINGGNFLSSSTFKRGIFYQENIEKKRDLAKASHKICFCGFALVYSVLDLVISEFLYAGE